MSAGAAAAGPGADSAGPGGAAPGLLSVGNVIIDLLLDVPALPPRGGDVLATARGARAGGSVNTLVAAARHGLPGTYGGAHGTGPFGDLARAALAADGIALAHPADPDRDTGTTIALTDADGERTFITAFGAEAHLRATDLARLQPAAAVHVSGYGLLTETNVAVLAPWLETLPPGPVVLLDPGPLAAQLDPRAGAAALGRAQWLSVNEREARELVGGGASPLELAEELGRRVPGVVVRLGPRGCVVASGGRVTAVPGIPVTVVDTNGAGDAHVGAFLAAIVRGESPETAARVANAAAAIAVTRPGPGTAPTLAETLALLAEHPV